MGDVDLDNSGHATDTGGLAVRKHGGLVLGLERIGLITLRFPVFATMLLALLTIIATLGIERIKVDDSLSQLFRSDSAEFHQYERVVRQFPSSEFDVLVVIEGKTL